METLPFNLIPPSLTSLVPGIAGRPLEMDELASTSRATVVIGLGGTGYEIVRRLKRLTASYYPESMREVVQYLVIDTTPEKAPKGSEPLGADEYVHLPAFDLAGQIRNLQDNPHLAEWWPGAPDRPYRPSFTGNGANRVRAVGAAVARHYMGSLIIPRLNEKIKRAIEVNAQFGAITSSIKFDIACSLAGGTGSSMAAEIAIVARMLGLRIQDTAYVTGVLVLDDAFRSKAKSVNTEAEFSANTFAALKEINHISRTRTYRQDYNGLATTYELPESTHRPFDVAYLLGLFNGRQALDSFESLADMIAAELMLEIASPMEDEVSKQLDNVRANDRTIAGQPAAYSSFALSSLVYPVQNIAFWCALKAHAEFSRQVLLTPRRPASDVEKDVLAFTQKAEIEEEYDDSLIDRLAKDDRGEIMPAPSLSYGSVEGLPLTQLRPTLQHMEESALGELALVQETIAGNVKPIQKRYELDLNSQVEAMIRDPERGPRYTAWFLQQLRQRLVAHRDEQMLGEQALHKDSAEQQQVAWEAAQRELNTALGLPGWHPLRSRRINASRNAYVAAFNAYLGAKYELERRVQAVACFEQFIQDTAALARTANNLVNEWENLLQVTADRAEAEATQARATETEYSLMHNIAGAEELQRTYLEHLPPMDEPDKLNHLASAFWSSFDQQVPGWTLDAYGKRGERERRRQAVREAMPDAHVYYFLFGWYAHRLEGSTLLERLQELHGDQWPRFVGRVFEKTSAFWNINPVRHAALIANNLQHEPQLVGYGEDNVEAWQQTVAHATGETASGVNTKNAHELVFLKTSHGLPLFALRAIDQTLRPAYDYVRRLWDERTDDSNPIPVHISEEWHTNLPDIDPVEQRKKTPSSNGKEAMPIAGD